MTATTRETNRLVKQLQNAYDGDAWFGPSVHEALEGVDARLATSRHVPGAHTICEIVLHMTAWTREVTRRLRDGVARNPEDGDWPVRTGVGGAEWTEILAAFDRANAELVQTVAAIDDERLRERIGDVRNRAMGSGVSRYTTVSGLVQHHAYHCGQISLLKKAGQEGPTATPA